MSDDQQYVTVRSAATSAGIPERTIRYWISEGKLAATAGKRGKLVSMRDVRELATLTGRDTAMPATAETSADGKPGNTAESLPSVAARSQLEAIRDEWLAPLIEQITDQAETIGRLTAELEHERQRAATATAAREALESRLSELEAQTKESPSVAENAPQTSDTAPWWQFWRRA